MKNLCMSRLKDLPRTVWGRQQMMNPANKFGKHLPQELLLALGLCGGAACTSHGLLSPSPLAPLLRGNVLGTVHVQRKSGASLGFINLLPLRKHVMSSSRTYLSTAAVCAQVFDALEKDKEIDMRWMDHRFLRCREISLDEFNVIKSSFSQAAPPGTDKEDSSSPPAVCNVVELRTVPDGSNANAAWLCFQRDRQQSRGSNSELFNRDYPSGFGLGSPNTLGTQLRVPLMAFNEQSGEDRVALPTVPSLAWWRMHPAHLDPPMASPSAALRDFASCYTNASTEGVPVFDAANNLSGFIGGSMFSGGGVPLVPRAPAKGKKGKLPPQAAAAQDIGTLPRIPYVPIVSPGFSLKAFENAAKRSLYVAISVAAK